MPSGNARKTRRSKRKPPKILGLLPILGYLLIAAALVIFALTFGPVILEELGYTTKHTILKTAPKVLVPVDTDFGIVIPKIEANAKIVANVDPYDSRIYQAALTKGVAHAKGTGVPGQAGNIFLFSHSSANFYDAARYNSIFYLLTKLASGDEIDLYYQGVKYAYRVTSKQLVPATAVQYLKAMEKGRETLTLMTCWPPGTSYKRLLVIAERQP